VEDLFWALDISGTIAKAFQSEMVQAFDGKIEQASICGHREKAGQVDLKQVVAFRLKSPLSRKETWIFEQVYGQLDKC
jgi:hypothetical protein